MKNHKGNIKSKKKNISKEKCKKKSYNDRQLAIRSIHLIQGIDDGRTKPIRAYQCNLCYKWHLTSKEENHGFFKD